MDQPTTPSNPTALDSKVSEIDNERLMERCKKTVEEAHSSLLSHILDLDLKLGGGHAAPALAAMSALTGALADHYVLEMRINLIRHKKEFQCVPMEAWKSAAKSLAEAAAGGVSDFSIAAYHAACTRPFAPKQGSDCACGQHCGCHDGVESCEMCGYSSTDEIPPSAARCGNCKRGY